MIVFLGSVTTKTCGGGPCQIEEGPEEARVWW